MDSSQNKIWFVDTKGAAFPRSELIEALDGKLRNVVRSSDTHRTVLEITKAIARGADLSLMLPQAEKALVSRSTANAYRDSRAFSTKWERICRSAAGETSSRIGMHTSGSTGIPNSVWQPVSQLARAVRVSDRNATATWGLAYKPTHVAGVQVALQALANGCPLVDLQGLSAAEVATAIAQHGVTHLSATPTFYRLLVASATPLNGVRSVTMGGEPADADLLDRVRTLFPHARIHNVYASTEAGTLLVSDGDVFSIPSESADRVIIQEKRLWVHRSLLGEFVGRAGKPDGARERVDGAPVRVCPEGVTTRGDKREDGHWPDGLNKDGGKEIGRPGGRLSNKAGALGANEEQTLKNPIEEWYDTGDRIEVIEEHPLRFRIVGRDRDWFNVGGHKVNPRVVESVLECCPGVTRARVSGRSNSVVGTVLVAELECQTCAPAEATIRVFAAARLPAYQVPRLIKVVEALPATWTGKLKRE